MNSIQMTFQITPFVVQICSEEAHNSDRGSLHWYYSTDKNHLYHNRVFKDWKPEMYGTFASSTWKTGWLKQTKK